MIEVYVEDKIIVAPKDLPLNIIYLEVNRIWRECDKVTSDRLRAAKIPMSFSADHTLGVINYTFINQWKLVEAE